MKKFLCTSVICVVLACPAFAEVITLNDGEVIEGEIIERTNDYIQVDVGELGIPITFFNDEIRSVQKEGEAPTVVTPRPRSTSSGPVREFDYESAGELEDDLGFDEEGYYQEGYSAGEEMASDLPLPVVIGMVVGGLIFYIVFCIALFTLANKTGTPNNWLAFIPIVQYYLACKIGGRPGWLFLIYLIPVPFVPWIFNVYVWMGIAEKRDKPVWVGVLTLVPVLNFIIPLYLAFSD